MAGRCPGRSLRATGGGPTLNCPVERAEEEIPSLTPMVLNHQSSVCKHPFFTFWKGEQGVISSQRFLTFSWMVLRWGVCFPLPHACEHHRLETTLTLAWSEPRLVPLLGSQCQKPSFQPWLHVLPAFMTWRCHDCIRGIPFISWPPSSSCEDGRTGHGWGLGKEYSLCRS